MCVPQKSAPVIEHPAYTAVQYDYSEWVDELWNVNGGVALKQILNEALSRDPISQVQIGDIMQERIQERERRAAEAINFSSEPNKVSYLMHEKYARLSSTKQYGKGFEVCYAIDAIIKSIGTRTAEKQMSWETKYSALDNLCHIGDTVVDEGGEIPRAVRMHFQHNDILEETMLEVISYMDDGERKSCETQVQGSSLLERLQALKTEAQAYCMLDKMGEVIKYLQDGSEDGSDEEEDEGSESE